MKFFTSIVALASAAVVYAQSQPNPFNIPPQGLSTSAGSSLNLSWTPTTQGTISLYLRSGNSAFLNSSGTIATGITNSGQYTWTVPSDIVRGSSYAVEIVSDTDKSAVNYTPQFVIDSSILTASTSGAASTTGSSTSGSATASASTSGSTSGASTTGTASGSTTASASGSSTSGASSTTKPGSSASSAGLQTAATTGGAPRATVMAGMLGAVALGALAL